MSIVKNTTGVDTAVTIRRFPKQTNIIDWIPGAGSIITSLVAKYYLQLNNKAVGDNSGGQMPRMFSFGKGDSVIIKAEISANAQGVFFGGGNPNGSVYISKSDNYVMWSIDGDAVATIPWEEGVHLYGWIGVEAGGQLYSQPWYDGEIVTGSSAETFATQDYILLGGIYGGDNVAPNCIHGSDYGIRIYEVIAETSEGSWHFYPCTYNGNNYSLFETLNRFSRVKFTINGSSEGGTSSVSVGEFPEDVLGIGVQLFDIKHVTGSGYEDLLALMAEDGGIDTQAGWDGTTALTPYNLTRTADSAQLPFAFWLGGSSQSGALSIPDGYTRPSGSREIGLLQMGRKPKWSIWNDIIDFGFYVFEDASINPRKYYLQFNFLKRISTTYGDTYHTVDIGAQLERFENYNTAVSAQHPPKITYSDTNLICHVHNGALAKCLDDDIFAGYSERWKDNLCVYKLNNTVGGSANWRVGNLLPWNFTDTELDNYGYSVRAVKFSIKYSGGNLDYFSDEIHDTNYARLCKNTLTSNPNLANTLRVAGKQLDLRIVDENKFSLLIDLAQAQGHTLSMVGKMQLLMGDNHDIELNVDRLFNNEARFDISAVFDGKNNQNSTNFRAILDDSMLAVDTTPMYSVSSDFSTDLHTGIIGAYRGMADLGVHTLFNYTNPWTSNSYSCIILPIMRFSWYNHGQHHDPCPIIEPNTYWPSTSSQEETQVIAKRRLATASIAYKAFVEVYTSELDGDNNPVYGHYITLINAMNGMGEFKKYCDYGSPTASSKLSGWMQDAGQDLMMQAWGMTDPMLEDTTLSYYSGQPCWLDKVESASPFGNYHNYEKGPFQASANSVKMFVVPRKLLGKVGEFNDNTTAIFHLLNTDSPKVFCAYDGFIRSDTYQKYNSISQFFKSNTSQPARSCYFVFTHPYYKYDIVNGDISTGIEFLFRTYVKDNTATNGYKYIEDICDVLDNATSEGYNERMYIRLYCYDGTVDYTALSNSSVLKPDKGRYVAKFEIRKSTSYRTDTWGNYTLSYRDDAASDSDFYNWGNEPAGTDRFQKFTLTRRVGSNPSYIPSVLYQLEIFGKKPDGWDSETPSDINP